jgi:hypothetical protein
MINNRHAASPPTLKKYDKAKAAADSSLKRQLP